MKLRLNDTLIRLRCRRSEVELFAKTGLIETVALFPDGRRLRIVLALASVDAPRVSFTGDLLEVAVPTAAAAAWTSTDEVSICGRHGQLDILVEKDFRRTSLRSPDDDDRYPNPRAER